MHAKRLNKWTFDFNYCFTTNPNVYLARAQCICNNSKMVYCTMCLMQINRNEFGQCIWLQIKITASVHWSSDKVTAPNYYIMLSICIYCTKVLCGKICISSMVTSAAEANAVRFVCLCTVQCNVALQWQKKVPFVIATAMN